MKKDTGYTLPAQEEKAQYLQKNFDQIAAAYDRFNDLFTGGMHRIWKRKTIRKALEGIKTGTGANRVSVLDLCSGSGDLALGFARNNQDRKVLALDFSAEMLSVLNAKRPADMKNLNIVQGDAMNLPAAYAGLFDIVSIGYGIRNLTDPRRGLDEAYRALKPGGMLV
ncbi:MAG: class I SAM-dependent methyltransferase, partial [Leptospiraceae bacterium]|nr:class I SAM-dependent methyltransferase [Leptospiraceae bacterium]